MANNKPSVKTITGKYGKSTYTYDMLDYDKLPYTKEFVDYKEQLPWVKDISDKLEASYFELLDWRQRYDTYFDARNRPYSETGNVDADEKNIFRSGLIDSAVSNFAQRIRHPEPVIESINDKSYKARENENMTKSVLEFQNEEAGYADAFNISNDDLFSYGDSYRTFSTTKDEDGNVLPSCETADSFDLLFDTNANYVFSKNDAERISFWAKTKIYARGQLEMKFGPDICKYACPGSSIDHFRYAQKTANFTSNTKEFYEVIEFESVSGRSKSFVVGKNMFPAVNISPDMDIDELDGDELKKFVEWKRRPAVLKDKHGRAMPSLFSNYMYLKRHSIRNYGITSKLARPQELHEILFNVRALIAQLASLQIPYIISGGTEKLGKNINNFLREQADHKFSLLKIPSNPVPGGQQPTAGVIKFDTSSQNDAKILTSDLYSESRNMTGTDLERLDVAPGEGLGQTRQINEDQNLSIAHIIKNNIPNIEGELEYQILHFIKNNGYGRTDIELSYTGWDELKDGSFVKVEKKDSLVNIAKRLKKFKFRARIELDSLFESMDIARISELTKLLSGNSLQNDKDAARVVLSEVLEKMKIYKTIENEPNTPEPGGGQTELPIEAAPGAQAGGSPGAQRL